MTRWMCEAVTDVGVRSGLQWTITLGSGPGPQGRQDGTRRSSRGRGGRHGDSVGLIPCHLSTSPSPCPSVSPAAPRGSRAATREVDTRINTRHSGDRSPTTQTGHMTPASLTSAPAPGPLGLWHSHICPVSTVHSRSSRPFCCPVIFDLIPGPCFTLSRFHLTPAHSARVTTCEPQEKRIPCPGHRPPRGPSAHQGHAPVCAPEHP